MSAGMSRIIKITLTLGALCVAAIANYLVRPESVSAQTSRETYGYTPQKGIPEGSDDPKALAGHYYRGDGTGYNVDLTLVWAHTGRPLVVGNLPMGWLS
jgi:hypothetical protein